jgi:hypothetical protein
LQEAENSGIIKQVVINEATVSLRKDGIVHVLFHKDVNLDLTLQMLLLNIYNEITGRKKHPFLFEAFEGITVTKEARENAVRIESEAPGCAYAVVADSIAYQLIAGFYLKMKKPAHPYKVFTTKEDAVNWLRNFTS